MWTVDDVIEVAQTMDLMNKHLTQEQRVQVLNSLQENFDANIGINWETVRCAINGVI